MSTHHTCIYNCGGSDCDAPPQLRPAPPAKTQQEGVTVREQHAIRRGDVVQLTGLAGDAAKLNGLYRIVHVSDTLADMLVRAEQHERKRFLRRSLWLGALAFGVAGLVAAVRWWLLQ